MLEVHSSTTTLGTLTKHDSMLRAMFSGRMEVRTDSEGWILIDRCGRHFHVILNYLRDGAVTLPDKYSEIAELLTEAKYYLLQGLVDACEEALQHRQRGVDAICRPVVKLLVNRHNNKYSYTSSSDENLLKNIELFDILALRFNGRVLFIKDVIGSNEICLWTYFALSKKMAEVCCTSIVYAPEKKNTKVEFPEAKIYEELLNILLYENKVPDNELLQATSTRGAVAVATNHGSDEEGENISRENGIEASHLGKIRSNKHQT
ncbi:BTB/POZ domain-containing adapter for CUL3-mediated RhoA degradation protein 2 [Nymphon striatum]|nr:BTB/POZ domain-containing adapter for CUL3-mediated RhoA degradation protein 2 [Nymphon striatum]